MKVFRGTSFGAGWVIQQGHQEPETGSLCSATFKVWSTWPLMKSRLLQKPVHIPKQDRRNGNFLYS